MKRVTLTTEVGDDVIAEVVEAAKGLLPTWDVKVEDMPTSQKTYSVAVKTYSVAIGCLNCRTTFRQDFLYGTPVHGIAPCPNCGAENKIVRRES